MRSRQYVAPTHGRISSSRPSIDLADEMRVGELRTRHADEVDLALANGVARRRDIVDLGGVQDGQLRRLAHAAGEVEVRRRRHAVDRDDLRQRRFVGDVAADDVDEVDEPVGLQASEDVEAARRVDAAWNRLVDGHADADDEVGPDPLADRPQDAPPEAQPVLEGAAVLVAAVVRQRRPELVEEVAVGLDLDAVHPARLHALCGVGVLLDDAVDVPVLGLLGHGAMRRLPPRRRSEDRQPVVLGPARAPAEVGQLDHARRTVLVDLVAHAADPRHDGVVVGVQVAERRRAVLGDDGRAGGHRQRDAALGLLDVVQPVAVLGHALFGVGGLVGGREDPVAQRQVAKLERLEQRVVAGGHRPQLLRSRRRAGDGARSARCEAGARASARRAGRYRTTSARASRRPSG